MCARSAEGRRNEHKLQLIGLDCARMTDKPKPGGEMGMWCTYQPFFYEAPTLSFVIHSFACSSTDHLKGKPSYSFLEHCVFFVNQFYFSERQQCCHHHPFLYGHMCRKKMEEKLVLDLSVTHELEDDSSNYHNKVVGVCFHNTAVIETETWSCARSASQHHARVFLAE